MKHQHSLHAFTLPVRVYYEDTDAAGVVYYANYLRFFERCRTEWMREIGHAMGDFTRDEGLAFVVRRVEIDYQRPARLDDALVVGLEVEKLGRAQVWLRQYVRRGDEELVTGIVQIVCVNVEKMKSAPIPAYLRAKLESIQ